MEYRGDWHCSHPSRNSHQTPSMAFTKGSGQQQNMYLKSKIAKEEKKGKAAAQRGGCLCGCHCSLLHSLQAPRESLVQESFRQAGLWDGTVPRSHI